MDFDDAAASLRALPDVLQQLCAVLENARVFTATVRPTEEQQEEYEGLYRDLERIGRIARGASLALGRRGLTRVCHVCHAYDKLNCKCSMYCTGCRKLAEWCKCPAGPAVVVLPMGCYICESCGDQEYRGGRCMRCDFP